MAPVAWFLPRRQCSRKSRRNVPPRSAGGVRPAHARRGQRAPHAVDRVVVELVVLLGRRLPVEDVRLVPDLPPPALDLGPAVALDRVLHPLLAQRAPLVVVLRRVGLPPVHRRALVRRRVVRVEVGPRGERLRHEADLDERLRTPREQRVEDAVEDRPVVDRASLCVLAVRVRRAPLERGRAAAARQQVVRADEHRVRAELRELPEQPLAVRHVGEVRLVVAEEPEDRPQLARADARVDADGDGEGRARARRRRRLRGGGRGEPECDRRRLPQPHSDLLTAPERGEPRATRRPGPPSPEAARPRSACRACRRAR